MEKAKVSIIVPIYNAEKYLRQCLDSIVGQTLAGIEIILVNDGSKDDSSTIMKEYAGRDKRVRIIDKPNEGYGKTMNVGLDAATGEYVGIVEADDFIEPDMYETLYSLAKENDAQVVKAGYFNYSNNQSAPVKLFPERLTDKVICVRNHGNNEIDIFYIQPSIWSAIYRRDFLNDKKIRFLESAGASYQDVGFNFKVWAMADRVWLTPKAFVHYRQHPDQSVASNGKVFCVRDEWLEIDRFMNDYPEWKASSAKLRNQVKLGNYLWNLNRLKGADKETFRKCFVEEYRSALRNGEIEISFFGTKKDFIKFLLTLDPDNAWLKLQRHLWNVGRVFLKSKTKGERRRWYILFGTIPVWSSSIVARTKIHFLR